MARPRSGTDEAVYAVLCGSDKPMTAYQLLDALRPQGVQSPPVVYRALERLERDGRVHRLEQLNAYFACHGQHEHAGAVFAVCRDCGRVEEWPGTEVDRALGAVSGRAGFRLEGRTIEVRGLCEACAGRDDGAEPGPAGRVHGCGHDHS
ncbi:Fur family transcriptional regulator [Prosthecomicrobium sp. N25]|uniref:Fur family transcriptional regulator n=1 Tax=Prosthecomicrobium sp. N25 TaxID=3129254 RepID=UPI0030771828